jgi:hypothetical protein
VDIGHLFVRLMSPFNPESRFYWPFAIAVLTAFVANIVWGNWSRRDVAPPEETVRPWAFWINVIFFIWLLVLLLAKPPFLVFVISLAANVGALVYLYAVWLPPREAVWEREQRRQRYIPGAERRRRRRR